MSIRIDYLTNGKKALYCVRNAGVTPNTYETYEKLDDIPESIRHYAPKGEPEMTTPVWTGSISGIREQMHV